MTTATSLPGQCLGHSSAGAELWATSSCSAQHYQAREYPHHQVQPDASMFEAWALRQVETQLQPVAAAQLPSELNAGVYKTDEFRMYSFKVRRCPKGPAHDWTDCPYCHPGEKAKRRDPRKYAYTGIACPDFRKASCKRGDACPYAHGVFECWLHPSRYRTQLCKDGTACTRSVCFFAHTLQELRTSSLSVSLSQDWKPKTFGTSPPSPTAPPLLSSEEGSPRSLGAKACHTEAELLQSLIPSPGSSYAGYSHLQPQPSTCSTSSLYSQAADTQSLLAPQSQLHQQMPQHVLAQQMQQHQQQLPHQLPQSQAQLQMEQAMRLLSIGSGNGYEGARQRAPSAQPALEHLAPATQAMLHAPAHRRPSHPKTLHQSSPPPMRIPSPAFPSASSQYLAGRGSNSPAATGGTMDHQWLEYLQASGHLSGHGLKSPPMRVPDARWMDYAVLNQSLPQPITSNGFPQHFVPRPEACVSW